MMFVLPMLQNVCTSQVECTRPARSFSNFAIVPCFRRKRYVNSYYSDDRRRLNLNLATLKRLDDAIVSFYEDWIENATPQYTEDGFFLSRRPVAVTSRFGQNQKLADTEEL